MAKLVLIKNPFDPARGRTISEYEGTIKDLRAWMDGVEVKITVDDWAAADDYVPKPNELVCVYPVIGKGGKGGKGILAIVASIALAVVSLGAGSFLAGNGFWAMSMAHATGWAYLGAAATMFIGGRLLSRMTATKVDVGSYDSENNSTYSWSEPTTMEGQNNPIAVTYGKIKSAGQTLGKYVSYDSDNNEILNWLIGCGEGVLSISDVRLNDNAIDYYDDVTCEIRSGVNDQTVISNFNDTYFSKSLGYELQGTDERIDTAQGTATEGIELKVEFPSGLFYTQDNGELADAWVDLQAYYRIKGTTEWKAFWYDQLYTYAISGDAPGVSINGTPTAGSYLITYSYLDEDGSRYVTVFLNGNRIEGKWIYMGNPQTLGGLKISIDPFGYGWNHSGDVTFTVIQTAYDAPGKQRITGKQSSALRVAFRKDNLAAGEYEVKMNVAARSHSETISRACVKCYWMSLTSIVYDDFSYPNIALIGIKGLATSQLSGTPTLSFVKERAKVWVYNSNALRYEQKNANNPAWAAYDMLHRCHKLKNINTGNYEFVVEGVPAGQIIYEQFNEWAAWCETNKLYINMEINSTGEMLDIVNNKIACIGRGVVLRFGTRYGVKWSHVQTPVQMFGMGNIIKDSFQETFLSKNDRANCVEITFMDAERDYERRTITVFGDSYNTDPVANPSQITYDGITSYEQAYREGKYLMECNERLLRTVSFDADIDAIACTVGDVVIVSHDVPQWSHSGRIESVATVGGSVQVTLPSVNEPLSGHNWKLRWRNNDEDTIYEESVNITFSNERIVATLQSSPSVNPNPGELFDLAIIGESRGLFTIQSITQSSKFRRHIEALQYDENVYGENYDIPSIIYTAPTKTALNVTGLTANQILYVDSAGVRRARMYVSWDASTEGSRYKVMYTESSNITYKKLTPNFYKIVVPDSAWTMLADNMYDTSVYGDVEPGKTYCVKVVTALGVSLSSGSYFTPVPPGEDTIPPDVTELNVEVSGSGVRRYYWTFEYPNPNDIAGFRIKYLQGSIADWNAATTVQEGLVTSQPYEATTVRNGAHIVMIKAVDNAGNESETPAICLVNFGDPIEENVLYTIDHHENYWADLFEDYDYWGSVGENYWLTKDTAKWGVVPLVWTSAATDQWGSADISYWQERGSTLAWGYMPLRWDSPTDDHWINPAVENGYVDEHGWLCAIAKSQYWATITTSYWQAATTAHWEDISLYLDAVLSFVVQASGYWWLKYTIVGYVTIWYTINEDTIFKQYSGKVEVKAGDKITLRFTTNGQSGIVKECTSIVDVPDRVEHFTDLAISSNGTTLPIKCPNYYTTAIRIDSLPLYNNDNVYPQIITRNPCVIKLVKTDGTAVTMNADITWQGFEKEVLS